MLTAAGRRPGLLGTVESRVGGEVRPVVRTTPEAIDLQRMFREMLDAGDRSVAMEASSHASVLHRLDRVRFAALVFTNLTPGPPRLPRARWRTTSPRSGGSSRGAAPPPAAVNVGDAWGRRLADELAAARRAPLLTFGLADDAEIRPEDSSSTRPARASAPADRDPDRACAAASTSRTSSARSRPAILLDVAEDAIAAGDRRARRRARAASRRSTRASPSR